MPYVVLRRVDFVFTDVCLSTGGIPWTGQGYPSPPAPPPDSTGGTPVLPQIGQRYLTPPLTGQRVPLPYPHTGQGYLHPIPTQDRGTPFSPYPPLPTQSPKQDRGYTPPIPVTQAGHPTSSLPPDRLWRGQYSSCGHAGTLSCSFWIDRKRGKCETQVNRELKQAIFQT